MIHFLFSFWAGFSSVDVLNGVVDVGIVVSVGVFTFCDLFKSIFNSSFSVASG